MVAADTESGAEAYTKALPLLHLILGIES
jgi:hypothetical protein